MASIKVKKWYQSRTMWTGIVTIVAGIGAYFTGQQQLQEVAIIILGAIFMMLRSVTESKIIQ